MSSNTDPYGYLGLIKNPNGSITRIPEFLPSSSPSSDPGLPVLTKDVPINQDKNTWARIYIPNPKPSSDIVPTTKLPLIFYYHGGGFILCSVSSQIFQKFLSDIVVDIPCVIVSVGYRLAPEHRLPAAYDDSMEALRWIKTTNDEWLAKYADFSKCFLMGTSAGGNIAYHVGLRASTCGYDLVPLEVQGLILHHPFFGGMERSPSEVRLINDHVLPLVASDIMWELALPDGADRDHEYCNVGMMKPKLNDGLKVLVVGCEGDPSVDRQIELVKILEANQVDVTGDFSNGGFHGCELFEESRAKIFNGVLKNFVPAV